MYVKFYNGGNTFWKWPCRQCRITYHCATKQLYMSGNEKKSDTTNIYIGLRKYGGLSSSAPEKYGCGLAVDITHTPDMSTGK